MYDKYTINFETKTITKKEAESESFKKLITNIKNTWENKYKGMPLNTYNITLFFAEIENLMEIYKYENPCSNFDIRPDSQYAFIKKYLTVEEIAKLYKKHFNSHEDKSEYTNMEVNNMLFDLDLIGQLNGYMSPAICYDIPSHNNKICNEEILVNKRIFDYR